VDIYQDIVMEDTSLQYAKDANRRIFIVGGLSPENSKVRELAMKNSVLLNDETFGKLSEESVRFAPADDEIYFIPERSVNADDGADARDLAKLKKIEKMIERVDERISGKTVHEKTLIKTPERRMVKIYTTDGNIFTGTLINDAGGSVVIRTSFGDISIEKTRISRRINL
jgi:hypothetical protein